MAGDRPIRQKHGSSVSEWEYNNEGWHWNRRSTGLDFRRPLHSFQEALFVLLGLSQSQRLLAVMYADRGETVRIISARRATRREQRNYEENAH